MLKQATDLRGAINQLDPERELDTPEELEAFIVKREDSPIKKLRLLLESNTRPQQILFSGHRGSGKSTELARLEQQIKDDFLVLLDYAPDNIRPSMKQTWLDAGLQPIWEDGVSDEDVLTSSGGAR